MAMTEKGISLVFALMMLVAGGCGPKITVCECLKDDGAHKEECDELGNSMTEAEMSREIAKCD